MLSTALSEIGTVAIKKTGWNITIKTLNLICS